MHLILLILRHLLGPLAPSWNEGIPLAVRRDGRLENRLHREADPQHASQHDREPSRREPGPGPLSLVWTLLVRAVTWVGRRLLPTGGPGGGS